MRPESFSIGFERKNVEIGIFDCLKYFLWNFCAMSWKRKLKVSRFGIGLRKRLRNIPVLFGFVQSFFKLFVRSPSLFLFRAIFFRIWKAKSSSQTGAFFNVVFFANWARAKNNVGSRFWTWKLFSLNCSKLAVECDWNSKNSQYVRKLGFFCAKQMVLSWKKILKFFKIAKCGKVLWKASQIVLLLKNSQNVQILGFLEEDGFFRKTPWNFSKSLNVANFFYNASQMVLLLENFFPP